MIIKKETLDKTILSNFAFCIIAIFIYIKSFNIPLGPAMFPKLLSIFLFGLNTFLIIQHFIIFIRRNTREITPTQNKKNDWKNIFNLKKYTLIPILVFILCCLFVFSYSRIGFELSAFLLVFSIMLLINRREAVRKFYLAILIPLIFLLIFKFGLSLAIPLTIDIFLKK